MPRKPANPEAIALSDFARRVECTPKTIIRYIEDGKIHGPAVVKSSGGKDKVIYELALPQYLAAKANVAHRFARAANSGGEYAKKVGGQKLNPEQSEALDNLLAFGSMSPFDAAEKVAAYRAGEYPLPEGPALDLLLADYPEPDGKPGKRKAKPGDGQVIPAERRPQPHGGDLKSGKDKVDADITGMDQMSEDELGRMDINALTKREAVLRVIAKQLEIGKTSGELVAIEKVYAGLFSFGVEIRKRIEAIPARIIDSIRNAKTRAEAMIIINKEINDALSSLANSSEVIDTIKAGRGK